MLATAGSTSDWIEGAKARLGSYAYKALKGEQPSDE
jgi:hypothetical protein